MSTNEQRDSASVVLGQKYAYATVALILGISSFINLVGMDKAILAIVFGSLALRSTPLPVLKTRRAWGQIGVILGILQVIVISTLLIIFRHEFSQALDALIRLQDAK